MVGSGATNSFMHRNVIQYLNATTVDVPAMRVTLTDGSYINCSTASPLYLKPCGNMKLCSSGVFQTVHVGCHVLYHVLLNLTSNVVLGMDWLYAINP